MKLLLPLFIGLSASSIIPSKRLEITVEVISVDRPTQLSDEPDIGMDGSLVESPYAINADSPQLPLFSNLDTTVTTGDPNASRHCPSLISPYKGFDVKCGSKASGEVWFQVDSTFFSACLNICSGMDKCSGIDYNKETWNCVLLTGDITVENGQGYDSAVRAKKSQALSSDKATTGVARAGECTSLKTPFNGLDLKCGINASGRVISVLVGLPFAACAAACAEADSCSGVSHDKITYQCLLLTGELQMIRDDMYDSAVRIKKAQASVWDSVKATAKRRYDQGRQWL